MLVVLSLAVFLVTAAESAAQMGYVYGMPNQGNADVASRLARPQPLVSSGAGAGRSDVSSGANAGGFFGSSGINNAVSSSAGLSTRGSLASSGFGATGLPSQTSASSCPEGQVLHAGSCVVPQVERNIFVYSAPEQSQSVGSRPNIPPPKVEHNIIFVRVPEGVSGQDPIIVPPPQQKNVVYVLNKGTTAGGQRVINVPAPAKTQPEVYFVNYDQGQNPTLPGGVDLQSALNSADHQGVGQVIGGGSGSGVSSEPVGGRSGPGVSGGFIGGGSSRSDFGRSVGGESVLGNIRVGPSSGTFGGSVGRGSINANIVDNSAQGAPLAFTGGRASTGVNYRASGNTITGGLSVGGGQTTGIISFGSTSNTGRNVINNGRISPGRNNISNGGISPGRSNINNGGISPGRIAANSAGSGSEGNIIPGRLNSSPTGGAVSRGVAVAPNGLY